MQQDQVQELYKQFLQDPQYSHVNQTIHQNSEVFRNFWKNKVLNPAVKELSDENDLDPIIQFLDTKAKGNKGRKHFAIATTGIRQGTWRRIFKFFKSNQSLRSKLDEILNADNDEQLIKLVNDLHKINKPFKNGLTGKKANTLNAIINLYNPDYYISTVSLGHRLQIMKKFNLGKTDAFDDLPYGEKIVRSNRWILDGLKNEYGLNGTPRQVSCFLYSKATGRSLWLESKADEINHEEDESIGPVVSSESDDSNLFALEEHFEAFLIGNWEQTDLGKKYDLIEEDGELVSQQYETDIGTIDILVTDKKTGDYVVIELKRGQASDKTIGQILRYMGWVEEHKAKNKTVKGIIIALQDDEKLKYALKRIKDVEYYLYQIHFSLKQVVS